jgi:hypothetical protein
MAPLTGWADVTTSVTVIGTGFVAGSRVTVDGALTASTFVGSTALIVTMSPRQVGTVEVAVVNPGGETTTAPQAFRYIETPLVSFAEAGTGFTTSTVRDAQGEIVQFDQSGQLIWADGTKLKGFPRRDSLFIAADHVCQCWFEIRFGTDAGERRAYLTADYGHDNPGTVLDLEIIAGSLSVERSQVYPPGTYTLSGVVTEASPGGLAPIAGVEIYILVGSGWRSTVTDVNGAYEIRGLYTSHPIVYAAKAGYQPSEQEVAIAGDTVYNIGLVAR